ncbi:MAG TPA: hypothetical protein VFB41_07090 [Solirubrobacteraceae bacterium]|nr:hypothetical protein [Solirubrobacteraceae bacterium]
MADDLRVERGWIYLQGQRLDDGRVERGSGGELRFSPVDAIQERRAVDIPAGAILKASVQRLVFWRR